MFTRSPQLYPSVKKIQHKEKRKETKKGSLSNMSLFINDTGQIMKK